MLVADPVSLTARQVSGNCLCGAYGEGITRRCSVFLGHFPRRGRRIWVMRWLEDVLASGWWDPHIAVQLLGRDGISQRSITYGDLLRGAAALAARLRSQVAEGERIAIMAASGPEYLIADLAGLIAGVVVVPVQTGVDVNGPRSSRLLRGARVLLVDPTVRQMVALDRLGSLPADCQVWTVDAANLPAAAASPGVSCDLDDIRKVVRLEAMVSYGEVALTGLVLDEIMRSLRMRLGRGWSPRYVCHAPLDSLVEQIGVYLTLQTGGTVVFSPLSFVAPGADLIPRQPSGAKAGVCTRSEEIRETIERHLDTAALLRGSPMLLACDEISV